MLRNTALYGLGTVLVLLGLVGLLLPLLPGVPLLIAAGVCFAAVSPRIAGRLDRHPVWSGLRGRWHASRGMPPVQRLRLGFWLAADASVNCLRGTPRR